jgi:hypothetical protein
MCFARVVLVLGGGVGVLLSVGKVGLAAASVVSVRLVVRVAVVVSLVLPAMGRLAVALVGGVVVVVRAVVVVGIGVVVVVGVVVGVVLVAVEVCVAVSGMGSWKNTGVAPFAGITMSFALL